MSAVLTTNWPLQPAVVTSLSSSSPAGRLRSWWHESYTVEYRRIHIRTHSRCRYQWRRTPRSYTASLVRWQLRTDRLTTTIVSSVSHRLSQTAAGVGRDAVVVAVSRFDYESQGAIGWLAISRGLRRRGRQNKLNAAAMISQHHRWAIVCSGVVYINTVKTAVLIRGYSYPWYPLQ